MPSNADYGALLGRQVTVTLGEEDGAPVIVKGQLLAWSDSGECAVRCDDGFVHYCWPMLAVSPNDGSGT